MGALNFVFPRALSRCTCRGIQVMSSCATTSSVVLRREEDFAVAIRIGGITVALHTRDNEFRTLLRRRYGHFVTSTDSPDFEFELQLARPFGDERLDDDVRVWSDAGTWFFQRGDFYAAWNQQTRRGKMRHLPNPYSVDAVLR